MLEARDTVSPPWQPLYFVAAGAALCGLAVAFGAAGTHVFAQSMTAPQVDQFRTGVEFQFFHGLGLIVAGVLARGLRNERYLHAAGWLFQAGILLFCFSLYGISLFEQKWLGVLAPLGGLSFMVGWACVFRGAYGGWRDE